MHIEYVYKIIAYSLTCYFRCTYCSKNVHMLGLRYEVYSRVSRMQCMNKQTNKRAKPPLI